MEFNNQQTLQIININTNGNVIFKLIQAGYIINYRHLELAGTDGETSK
ncbi:hypothetical protein [Shewanella aestuarii]|uniref:Uncharacterized protein n=1 Tax=Shewanella aestuarii TaxID=1028752 RepID=A0A6G9QLI9_9GAMM|nr:hypothetical protein [Shewanella aestuarii]QIR14993.1 hypothetical protein HBH39_11295 [Shewanella aestuarii]